MRTTTRQKIERNLVKTAIDAATMPSFAGDEVSGIAAITIAFMLGIRFGIKSPDLSGQYMHRWATDISDDPNTLALNHERAIQKIIRPIEEDL